MVDDVGIVPMIEAELHFFEEESEVLLPAAMVHLESALGEAPEVLDPVDVGAPLAEGFGMVDSDVVKPLEVELVVGPVAIGVDPGLGCDMLADLPVEGLLVQAVGEDHPHGSLALEDAEDGNLARGATAAYPLPVAAEVGLVHLDFTAHGLGLPLALGQQDGPEPREVAEGRLAVHPEVFRHALGGHHEPEQPDNLPQGLSGNAWLASSPGELLPAAPTFPSPITEPVGFPRVAFRAPNSAPGGWQFFGHEKWFLFPTQKSFSFLHLSSLAWST